MPKLAEKFISDNGANIYDKVKITNKDQTFEGIIMPRNNFSGEIRIDGIEARGLDEDLELVVDRTPIRNHLAQSTPELIVRRLAARAQGPSASIFASLCESFKN